MGDSASRVEEGHPQFSTGDQDVATIEEIPDAGGRLKKRRWIGDLDPGGPFGFELVRGDDIDQAVMRKVANLRVKADWLASGASRPDRALQEGWREEPLVVVGEDDCVGGRERGQVERKDLSFDGFGDQGAVFAIGADHLLAMGDDSGLAGSRTIWNRQEPIDRGSFVGKEGPHPPPGLIFPENADRDGLRAQREQVGHHIPSASQLEGLAANLDDRDRGFGGDPTHLPPDELIEHEVSKDDETASLEPIENRFGSSGFDQVAQLLSPTTFSTRGGGFSTAPESTRSIDD
jgi:hypothetical protein